MSKSAAFVTATPLPLKPFVSRLPGDYGKRADKESLKTKARTPITADIERPFINLNPKWLQRLKSLHNPRLFRFRRNINTDIVGQIVPSDEDNVHVVYGENEPYPETTDPEDFVEEPDLPFDKRDWASMYRTCTEERDMWISLDLIEGQIPRDIVGTMFRNIPAGLHAGSYRFKHMFDGDGMICKIVFDRHGRVRWSNRYVRTEGFVRERQEQDMVYRATFGREGRDERFGLRGRYRYKNVGNTNVVHWGGKLLALWENGLPYRMNPFTLETEGLDNLSGQFFPGITFTFDSEIVDRALRLGHSFTAHPYVFQNHLHGFNYLPKSDNDTQINCFEFDKKWNLVRRIKATLPGFSFFHDFSVTPNYYVVIQNPVTIDRVPMILGQKTPGECIRLAKNANLRIVLIPRNEGAGEVRTLQTDARVCFHHVNAYEKEDGTVILNAVVQSNRADLDVFSDFRFPRVDFHRTGVSRLTTFSIMPGQRSVVRSRNLRPQQIEFTTINPAFVGREHRYIWMCESLPITSSKGEEHYIGSPMQIYAKYDLETGMVRKWYAGQRHFVNEPVFVPRENAQAEDDGYLIGFVFDAGRRPSPGNDLVILDAAHPERGPVATIHLPVAVPPGLHACWSSQVFYEHYKDN